MKIVAIITSLFLLITLSGCSTTTSTQVPPGWANPQNASKTTSKPANTAIATQKPASSKKTVPDRPGMYGKSDKLIYTLSDSFDVSNVRNDKTGNWRICSITSPINMVDYADSYYTSKFKNNQEIHWIVNFTNQTTTCISYFNGILSVDVHAHVSGEEHYADTLGSGTILEKYYVYTDNKDIEKIK